MIVETLLGFTLTLIQGLFSGFQIVNLPTDLLTALLDFLCYGTWVIGADLMAIFLSTVVGMYTFKFSAGLVLFLWRLLPLT